MSSVNPFGLTKIGLAILTVMLIVCSDMFGISMVMPVQAMYAKSLGTSTEWVGLIGSTFSACSFLASLVMGKVSDKYGRRTTFLVTGIGATLAYAGCAVCTSFYDLLVCRALAGLLSGTMGNALAYLSDITSKEERPIYMSYMTAVMASSFVVGPMIGGGLAVYGLRYPYLGATLFAAGVVVLTFTSLQEPEVLLMKKKNDDTETEDDNEQAEETRRVLMVKQKSFRQVYGRTPSSMSNKSSKGGPVVETTPLAAATISTTTATDSGASSGLGPWADPKALLVGGLCKFLRDFTVYGIVFVLPLILMEPSFGYVSPPTDTASIGHRWLQEEVPTILDGDGISTEAARRISLTTGYLVGYMGVFQTTAALVLFPLLVPRLGQLQTATAGALCMSLGGLTLLLVTSSKAANVSSMLPCLLAHALGANLTNTVLSSQLSQLAPPGKTAEYMSIIGTFASLGTMCAGNLTFVYARSRVHALGMITVSALLLAAVLGWLAYDEQARNTLPDKDKEQDALEKLFGAGQELPQEQFFDELQIALITAFRERGWSRGLQTKKGQTILLELLVASVPQLPAEYSEKMHAMNELHRRTSDEDEASDHARGLVHMSRDLSIRI